MPFSPLSPPANLPSAAFCGSWSDSAGLHLSPVPASCPQLPPLYLGRGPHRLRSQAAEAAAEHPRALPGALLPLMFALLGEDGVEKLQKLPFKKNKRVLEAHSEITIIYGACPHCYHQEGAAARDGSQEGQLRVARSSPVDSSAAHPMRGTAHCQVLETLLPRASLHS
ncbi:hypothetical protein H920_06930 [Fukomys damarensis]|uniref:Uncharacterized protein n=1 Tax=Fukomys damarensis TaxID=885580 RepID=A0A091E974_FUKDA|nr:hypothetical protein H920_06930 [Fukomys damarensis]